MDEGCMGEQQEHVVVVGEHQEQVMIGGKHQEQMVVVGEQQEREKGMRADPETSPPPHHSPAQ